MQPPAPPGLGAAVHGLLVLRGWLVRLLAWPARRAWPRTAAAACPVTGRFKYR
jgi:hypothetical protein